MAYNKCIHGAAAKRENKSKATSAKKNRSLASDYFTKGKEKCSCCEKLLPEFDLDCMALTKTIIKVSDNYGVWRDWSYVSLDHKITNGLFLILSKLHSRGCLDLECFHNDLGDYIKFADGEEESA